MLRTKIVAVLMAAVVLGGAWAVAEDGAESAEKKLKDIKCPVSGRAVVETASKEYKEAKVYFCCENCPKAFEKDTAKFAAKANHQLVATKQFKQKACPLSGQPASEGPTVKVADVEVKVCCDKCKAKVDSADGDIKVTLVFSDTAFKKGFEIKKEEEKKEKDDAAL